MASCYGVVCMGVCFLRVGLSRHTLVLLNWLYCTCNWKHLFLGKACCLFCSFFIVVAYNFTKQRNSVVLWSVNIAKQQGLFSFQIEPKISTGCVVIWNRRTKASRGTSNEFIFTFSRQVVCIPGLFFPSHSFPPQVFLKSRKHQGVLYMNGNSIYYTNDLITLKCKLGFCLYVHMEKQTLRSFSSYYRVLYRLQLVINISHGYLQLMLLLHQISLFSFLSVIYGCHCTDCGMFQCNFSFCMLLF